jgi:protocatechuate 3,4-dioxygenase, beta subunit
MDERGLENQSRRHFVVRAAMFAAVLPAGCRAAVTESAPRPAGRVGGPCDGCEAIFEGMPKKLHPLTRIAAEAEAGEPMEISGTLFQADAKTPARDVILYVYHTDAAGYYTPEPSATGLARRHGHLRGWMMTDAKGSYRFRTIRPAAYPNRNIEAHVHAIVKEPDLNEYWIDDMVFDDDPLLTPEVRSRRENRGGSGVLGLTKQNGVWIGRRDIVLGQNIPDYR